MNVKMQSFVLISVFLANLVLVLANSAVPVLIWGNRDIQDLRSASGLAAGHSLSKNHFTEKILNKLHDEHTANNLVIFLKEKLSLDDITQYSDAYSIQSTGGDLQNLKNLMASGSAMHLPRVQLPADAIEALKKTFEGDIHHLQAPFDIGDLQLDKNQNNLVFVDLEKDVGSLKEADGIINAVSKKFSELELPYNAMLTAKSSSKVSRQPLNLGRHLLAEAQATDYHFYNISSCIFFYADSIQFELKSADPETNSTWMLRPDANSDASTCLPNPQLNLKFETSGELKSFELSIDFTNTSAGYWKANSWRISFDVGVVKRTDVVLNVGDIYGPYKVSYHCTDPVIKQPRNGTETRLAKLHVKNLQIQGYQIAKDKFGRPSDCIGFFTIPIWMAICSIIVLLAILFFGVTMLARVDTMDRFDDPKGKTITVNVSD